VNEIYIIALAAAVLCGIVPWLLIPRRGASRKFQRESLKIDEESLRAANHYLYFPQIRQALSRADALYLAKHAPPRVARRALRERRLIARRFLTGLHDDFAGLDKLGRAIAALSPEVSQPQETQRLLLRVKFQALYALVWLRLSVGMLPLDQLEILAALVGRLATRIDEAMTEIDALSAGQLVGKLNA